jgi:hypothetical protein
MNYMESNQRFGQDLSIRGPKSNSIDYLNEMFLQSFHHPYYLNLLMSR